MYVLQQRGVHSLVLHTGQKHRAADRRGDRIPRQALPCGVALPGLFPVFFEYLRPLERLRALYGEALAYPGVAGIVIGTRPDCVDAEKLDYLAEIARDRYVAVEFGIESTCDETLRAVNRGHDFACARRAVEMAAERGLHVGAHFILGLPGETDEMLLEQVATINSLPLTT